MEDDNPPNTKASIAMLILLAIILLLAILYPVEASVKSSNEVPLSKCFLEDNRPYIEYQEKNPEMLNCLAHYESSSRPEAINWNDNGSPSWGLLQFKRSTYNYYCVNKYGLPDDIMDPTLQRECADKMISAGGLSHWSTRNKCL